MLLGLVTLGQLRAVCLPSSFTGTDFPPFDPVLINIGRGVSAQFDTATNRKLVRQVGAVETFSGGEPYVSLARYPVEKITLAEWIYGANDPQPVAVPSCLGTNLAAGIVGLGALWGVTSAAASVRLTYSGGYHVPDDLAEPTEENPNPEPVAVPDGATVIPGDLSLACQLQCAHVFEAMNFFGDATVRAPNQFGRMPPLAMVETLPTVKDLLTAYVRF